eukprot:scaffold4286_cov92-Amphora_coffeaeformis.AAC.16
MNSGIPKVQNPPRNHDKPNKRRKRPLTAYNIFFRDERQRLLQQFSEVKGQVPDNNLISAMVAKAWRRRTLTESAHYDALAAKERYTYALDLVESTVEDHPSGESWKDCHPPNFSERSSAVAHDTPFALQYLTETAQPDLQVHSVCDPLPATTPYAKSLHEEYVFNMPLAQPACPLGIECIHKTTESAVHSEHEGDILLLIKDEFDEDDAIFLREVFDSEEDSQTNAALS